MPSGVEQLKLLRAALIGLALMSPLPALAEPTLNEVSLFVWKHPATWFGGFSGLKISDDGSHITAVTDRGSLVTARLSRDAGVLTGVELRTRTRLKHRNGQDMRGFSGDAEGLSIAPDGTHVISFEGHHRIAQVLPETGLTMPLADIPGHKGFGRNNGFEALARHPDGSLYALPEMLKSPTPDHLLYRFANGAWSIVGDLPRSGPFVPVGADFGPDGLFYLLERTVGPLGFRTRIRRFDLAGQGFRPQTLLTTQPGVYGNLEGLSVWQNLDGQIRVITISDDNFVRVLSTQIVEFVLTE